MSAIYLDANATTSPLPQARAALVAAAEVHGNPSSPHQAGRRARALLDRARDAVAEAFAAAGKDVIFTSGASEANRWLVDAVLASHADTRPRVWTTPFEHPSLQKPLAAAHEAGRIALDVAALAGEELVLEGVERADVALCTAAHSETGLLVDLDGVAARLRSGALLFVDAAQTLGRVGPPPARADGAVCSAHKFGGYAGAGALMLRHRARTRLRAPWRGGGQEGGLRPGTEATVLHAAMGAAAAEIVHTREANAALGPVRDALEAAILDGIAGARVVGASSPRLPQTTAISFDGADGDALRMLLDDSGLQVGFGSACSALAPEPSAALLALGLSPAQARATVRLSLPVGFGPAQLASVVAQLATAVRQARL